MRLRHLVFLFLLTLPLFLQNCAQVAQPPGGKKDTLAPRLVSSLPKQRALNYAGKTVELEFDEYVNSENLQQKVTITPQDSNTFIVKSLPQGVRLTFAKPLQPNTTYTINFSDGIKDVTERNVATESKIVFSTGPAIDSLYLTGNVVDDETRLPLLNFVVGLFSPNDTLPINRKRPAYFARTDSMGNYRIENVKTGQYKVYGFDDNDLNLVNNTAGERVAFRDSVVDLSRNVTDVSMVAFRGYGKPRISRRERTDETLGLELSSGIAGYRFTYQKPGDTLVSFLESPPDDPAVPTGEPGRRRYAQPDGGGRRFGGQRNGVERARVFLTPPYTGQKPDAPARGDNAPTGEPLDNNLEFTLTFNKPVLRYSTDLIIIGADSTKPLKLDSTNLTWTNRFSRLVIKRQTTRNDGPLRDTLLFRVQKGAFISVQGDTLARYSARYTIAEEDSYGLIAGRVNRPDGKFIVELLDEKYQVVRTAYGTPTYSFGRLRPGQYRVRLIVDANGNRRRDIGNVQKGIQPETIIYYSGSETAEGGIIPVKQNFELTDIDF